MERNGSRLEQKYLAVLTLFIPSLLLVLLAPASAADRSAAHGPSAQTKSVERGLVILVNFPDVQHPVNKDMVKIRFGKQLNDYVQEMSYGKVSLAVDVTERWYTMPHPVGHYRISSRNLEVDKTLVRELIDDALNGADKDVDFSRYSFTAIFLGAKLADYGMIGLCGYPGMLGWMAEGSLKTKSGQVVRGGVAIFCFQAHLGTLFHDVAHILGGVRDGKRRVPCLYDHDLQAKPGPMRETSVDATIHLGFWDPMSCHYYKREIPPPGVCSWTKMRLNWIDPAKIKVVQPGEKAEVVLGPLEDGSAQTLVVKINISANTYYLLENRQPIGFDRNLPGSGVLILFADDSVGECRHGKAPVRLMAADPTIPHLEGAAFDVGQRNSFEDRKNKFRIQLTDKVQGAYKIVISPL